MRALEYRLRGGDTLRFHSYLRLNPDRVGGHSYRVAQIVRYLAKDLTYKSQFLLVAAALDHDIAEQETGDMPAPTKRAIPGLREAFVTYEDECLRRAGIEPVDVLDDEERKLLKLADSLDGMWNCVIEKQMGNRSKENEGCFKSFQFYVLQLWDQPVKPMLQNFTGAEPGLDVYRFFVGEWYDCK